MMQNLSKRKSIYLKRILLLWIFIDMMN